MKLPEAYYHCFLGNGLDAVLIGPTGSMTSDKVSVDRCAWYKSDRYYPEDKLVMVAGRWPLDKPLAHAEGSGWFEVAPLGRTWYSIARDGSQLALQDSQQRFVPQEGTLYSTLDYGPVKGEAVTWMHPRHSLLVERYTFDQDVEFTARMAPGVWVDDIWDTDPYYSVMFTEGLPEYRYDLGETNGIARMALEADSGIEFGSDGSERWLKARGKTFTKYFAIIDDRQGALDPKLIESAIAKGYDALHGELLTFWRDYFAVSGISIPDAQFQYFYDASMYHMKAMQNPVTGGLPVNNLRRTWSSHIFWDSYYLQRALLEANHRAEAIEGARFFLRTIEHARRHAREEFGCDGLKWDWEITQDGRKAYGALLHMKFQIHNNGSYANEFWSLYEYMQDKAYLEEFWPLFEGLAKFYLNCIVITSEEHGYEIGYQVGVHESPTKVRNDGMNLAATTVILRHYANAARILGRESDLSRRCEEVAAALFKTQESLYNGRYFKASEDKDTLNFSSFGVIYPMTVFDAKDPRAISSANAFVERYQGRTIGHGGNETGFPWSAGVLSAILAMQGNAKGAWEALEGSRTSICIHGGMTEVLENGEWNMQYFGTAQAACVTALHKMLLQAHGESIHLFPALPPTWKGASFRGLLVSGLTVSAALGESGLKCQVKNESPMTMTRTIRYGDRAQTVTLKAGEEKDLGGL